MLSERSRHTAPHARDPTRMKRLQQAEPRRRRADEWLPGARGVGLRSDCLWAQGFLWGNEMFWNPIEVTAAQHSKPTKCHQIVH